MNFICGTFFKHQCRYRCVDYLNERQFVFSFKEDKNLKNNKVFCKIELINELISSGILQSLPEYELVFHNSDVNFDSGLLDQLFKFPNLKRVYTQNLIVHHEKTYPIPIGIANPKWSHGSQDRFEKMISSNIPKTNMVYVNFNLSTNFKERQYCLEQINKNIDTQYPNAASISAHDEFVNKTQEKYLRDIKCSYFVVSPDGNGKDCHKTWESIYMGSVPIVTDSYFARKFKEIGVPLLIINDWSEFNDLSLSQQRYHDTWKNFDIRNLETIFNIGCV